MSTRLKTANNIHGGGYQVPRPVAELDAVLDNPEVTDEELVDVFVEAFREAHTNFMSRTNHRPVCDRIVTEFAERRSVEQLMEEGESAYFIFQHYGPKLIAATSKVVFLHRMVQKELRTQELRDVQAQAFDRLVELDPTYIARAFTEGSDVAKTIAANRIGDTDLVQRALSSPKTPLAVRVVLADRFLNDAVVGPLVVRSLVSTASVLDARIAQAKSQPQPKWGVRGQLSQLEQDQVDLKTVGAAMAKTAEAVHSDALAGQIVSAVAGLSDELPTAQREAVAEVALFRGLTRSAAPAVADAARKAPAFSLANEIPVMARSSRSMSLA